MRCRASSATLVMLAPVAERHCIQVRWPDLDGLGHVNHSSILVYLEVGREASFATRDIFGDDYVVRHCEVDYRSELRPTGPHVEYECDRVSLGNTSIRTVERLLDPNGECAVEARFTLVMWDAKLRRSRMLTPVEREKFASLEKEHQNG